MMHAKYLVGPGGKRRKGALLGAIIGLSAPGCEAFVGIEPAPKPPASGASGASGHGGEAGLSVAGSGAGAIRDGLATSGAANGDGMPGTEGQPWGGKGGAPDDGGAGENGGAGQGGGAHPSANGQGATVGVSGSNQQGGAGASGAGASAAGGSSGIGGDAGDSGLGGGGESVAGGGTSGSAQVVAFGGAGLTHDVSSSGGSDDSGASGAAGSGELGNVAGDNGAGEGGGSASGPLVPVTPPSTGGLGSVLMTSETRMFQSYHTWPDPLIFACTTVLAPDGLTETELASYTEFGQYVRSVLESGWEREANIDFYLWEPCSAYAPALDIVIQSQAGPDTERGYSGEFEPRFVPLAYTANAAEILYQVGRALGFENEYGLDSLPGPCTTCGEDADCTAPDRDDCLPSGFCGRLSDHESIMAPPDCGGVESSRQLSPWDIAGARRAYGRKPPGSITSALRDCLNAWPERWSWSLPCLGYEDDTFERRAAPTPGGSDLFAATQIPGDVCLTLMGDGLSSDIGLAECDATSPMQDFRMDPVRVRGLGGLCVVAGGTLPGARLMLEACGTATSVEYWTVRDDQLRLANTDLCATVEEGVTNSGTPIVLDTCGKRPEWQTLRFEKSLIRWNGQCVRVSGSLPIPGRELGLWSNCDIGSDYTDFYFSGPIATPGNGGCVSVSKDRSTGAVTSDPCNEEPEQEWDFHF